MPLDQYHDYQDQDQNQEEKEKIEVKRTDEMNFWEHLEELRKRIMRALLAIMVSVIGVFSMGEWLFMKVINAPVQPDFVTYKFMCQIGEKTGLSGLCITPPTLRLYTRELGEMFFKHMQVSLVLGLLISTPVIFWQVWLFIKPGLMAAEIKAARGFVFVCSSLFILGVLFGYYIVTPFAVSFLANYKLGGIGGESTVDSYVSYLTMFTLPLGLVFELPVIIYFLSVIGIVTPKLLSQYRRHMIVVLLIVAGIITPSPDIVSQLLVGVPLYLLYEVGIVVSKRVYEQKRKKEEENR
jgi:sec-independent protein translocase protein TatC